jgi:hypothetical protein
LADKYRFSPEGEATHDKDGNALEGKASSGGVGDGRGVM